MSNDAARPTETAATPADDSVASEMTRSLHRSTASYELAFAPVIMALLGLWLDKTIGTTPVFTVTLAVVGTLGAGISVYYSYNRSMERVRAELPWNRTDRPAATPASDGGAS